MPLKNNFTDEEKFGLSEEEITAGLRYMRKHRTYSVLSEIQSAQLFEMFLLGDTIARIQQAFPQYPFGQICLTAALKRWAKEREVMVFTLQDRVKAKVVKSVLEQVDFYTTMLTVANVEHLQDMMNFIKDPVNNPKPQIRIESIKDHNEVSVALGKLVQGATTAPKAKSPMFEALNANQNKSRIEYKDQKPKSAAEQKVIDNKESDKDVSIFDV